MNCNCRCTSKCHLLGDLEQQIMDTLWSSDKPLKPSSVRRLLGNKHAYTTVMTVLKRLTDKQLLSRTPSGNFFLYHPIQDKSAHACSCLNDLFDRLFESYGAEVIVHFKSAASRSGHAL